MANGYIVHFGNDNAPTAIRATPDRRTGLPTGEQFEQVIVVGTHQMINRARVWGRRVMGENGKIKVAPDGGNILALTPGYRGEVEFLDWGTEGGHSIEIRYIPQSLSLDYEFQDKLEKIEVDKEKGFTFLEFKTGNNEFDYKKDGLLIKFLKVYPQNRGSRSKNPDPLVKGFKYFEITEDSIDKSTIKRIETGSDAVNLVKEVSNKPGNLKNLFQVIGGGKYPVVHLGKTTILSHDLEMYKVILEYAEGNADDFFALIKNYKEGVQDDFEKAKSYKALDLTKHGHIAWIYEGKTQLIMSDVKGKGDEMINWFIENYCEEDVFKATQILKELVSKLK